MNPEDYKKMLGKYIKALILPKFPEINDFIVQSQSRSDGKEGGYAYIIFYTEGKKQRGFNSNLHQAIQQMRTYLSIPESVTILYDVLKRENLS